MHLKTDTGSALSHFARVPTISRSRNAFGIAEKHITTMQFDYLYPVWHKFIYPGDTLSITQRSLARLQTQIAVLYDDLYFDAHAWFVPMRLIQTNWARYQFNAQPAGPTQDNSSLTSPSIDLVTLGAGGFVAKSLYDYFGYPTAVDLTTSSQHINNYLGRAYNLIWNENYRDQNLQTPATVDLDDGPDLVSDYVLKKRGKRHDKFTSCLTAPQKGTGASIPISGTATVALSTAGGASPATAYPILRNIVDQSVNPLPNGTAAGQFGAEFGTDVSGYFYDNNGAGADDYQTIDPNGAWSALFTTSNATINQLRTSVAVQHLLEADARGGTRDVEAIKNRWGVEVPDFRLQRPEYLGGSTWTFDGHIVPQTSETGTTPQATLKQFSQAMNAMPVNHSFVEHGVFMILLSCRSNITYQQGLQRELSYRTRFDWYQPEFANLGEVSVLNKEIYLQGVSADNNTFGYQEYGYELRYSENRVSAEMRSNYATSLDSRHMADDYSSLPTLGSAWIQSNTDISRNIAVSAATADPVQLHAFVSGKIARTLPMYSIPGLDRL